MKKLIVLVMVFGLATAANATLVDAVNAAFEFSLGGLPQPDEVTIICDEPSGQIVLDLKLLDGHTTGGFQFDYRLSNAQAELLATNVVLSDAFDQGLSVMSSSAQNYEFGGAQVFNADLAGPITMMDQLVLHCLEATDVILTIVSTATSVIDGTTYYDTGVTVHTLTIHQVPEPATLALLGLGGLLLRRRKK